MTTAVLEKPTAVTKSDKAKAREGKAARAALNAMQGEPTVAGYGSARDQALGEAALKAKKTRKEPNPGKAAPKASDVIYNVQKNKKAEKAALAAHAAEIAKVAEKKAAAPVKAAKAKAAPKTNEPKPRKLSAMWVIRCNLAESLATTGKPATVEMISKACAAAGVPKADATIGTIVSDFMQCFAAMKSVGLVKA
jgi:hypothetical protein